ncbi:MAG: hypothetical protein SPH37_08760, partial [Sodaliphilus sp.]|nr:hypothetical protein [Sodaliphilus sp.]
KHACLPSGINALMAWALKHAEGMSLRYDEIFVAFCENKNRCIRHLMMHRFCVWNNCLVGYYGFAS